MEQHTTCCPQSFPQFVLFVDCSGMEQHVTHCPQSFPQFVCRLFRCGTTCHSVSSKLSTVCFVCRLFRYGKTCHSLSSKLSPEAKLTAGELQFWPWPGCQCACASVHWGHNGVSAPAMKEWDLFHQEDHMSIEAILVFVHLLWRSRTCLIRRIKRLSDLRWFCLFRWTAKEQHALMCFDVLVCLCSLSKCLCVHLCVCLCSLSKCLCVHLCVCLCSLSKCLCVHLRVCLCSLSKCLCVYLRVCSLSKCLCVHLRVCLCSLSKCLCVSSCTGARLDFQHVFPFLFSLLQSFVSSSGLHLLERCVVSVVGLTLLGLGVSWCLTCLWSHSPWPVADLYRNSWTGAEPACCLLEPPASPVEPASPRPATRTHTLLIMMASYWHHSMHCPSNILHTDITQCTALLTCCVLTSLSNMLHTAITDLLTYWSHCPAFQTQWHQWLHCLSNILISLIMLPLKHTDITDYAAFQTYCVLTSLTALPFQVSNMLHTDITAFLTYCILTSLTALPF